jgi:hypothetical protein
MPTGIMPYQLVDVFSQFMLLALLMSDKFGSLGFIYRRTTNQAGISIAESHQYIILNQDLL